MLYKICRKIARRIWLRYFKQSISQAKGASVRYRNLGQSISIHEFISQHQFFCACRSIVNHQTSYISSFFLRECGQECPRQAALIKEMSSVAFDNQIPLIYQRTNKPSQIKPKLAVTVQIQLIPPLRTTSCLPTAML